MRKLFITALFGVAMGIGSAQAAEIVVNVRPPISIHEHVQGHPADGMCGLADTTAGTGNGMYGNPDAGKSRPVNMRYGWLPGGSTGITATFSSRDAGGKSAKAALFQHLLLNTPVLEDGTAADSCSEGEPWATSFS